MRVCRLVDPFFRADGRFFFNFKCRANISAAFPLLYFFENIYKYPLQIIDIYRNFFYNEYRGKFILTKLSVYY